ncbi:restriction endonuclease [Desulforhopalus singaporensis]|uniref:Restriction endonuclease n=1 Tax=Desulforhopalus singaporensis TaxID=91360 RepID=A0A1H0UWJ6_9BACT|nr:restriction endonuclease [Desulforhopalus singaporensis]SDP70176.1 Restriction endonuclease [Desulforhopalus singaporensis]
MASDKQKILKYLTRCIPEPGIKDFTVILREAVSTALGKNGELLDKYLDSSVNRYWNCFKNLIEDDKKKGIKPIAIIVDNELKKFTWFVNSENNGLSKKKNQLLKAIPSLLKILDKENARRYESLGCYVSELLGASKVHLTPPGNEAGIDFIASIKFSDDSHFLFGINGPIRIIGQCKKYESPVQVSSIKEFNQTLQDVYSLTPKMIKILPDWFRRERGPILGWFISHSGFQSGALDRAKNYGIIASDSRDIAEVVACSKKFYCHLHSEERAKSLEYELRARLDE